ncbi:MAG: ROK family transcriptional regulator [Lentisphaerae bacterium]|nr:ROK family transcriptional regulator [Lentisphaerota bacterium]
MRFTHISGKRRIFEKLRREGRISRAELARKCSLTRPAVSAIVEELIADGLVRELGPGRSTGGKPPIMLEFVPEARCAIGINLGGDGLIEGVLCNLSCGVLRSESVAYENNFENILQGSERLVRMLSNSISGGVLAGVGIAVSGLVDNHGIVVHSSLDIVGKPLAEMLEHNAGVPVKVERRPNAAALAEALFGAGRDASRLVYLTSGFGVGAGLVINNEIFTGSHGFAGEVGRMHLPDSRVLEEAARPSEMLRKYADATGMCVDMDEFICRYQAGDRLADSMVLENARFMAYAAGIAAELFDPDALVLGGDVLEFGERHFETFRREFLAVSTAAALGKPPVVVRSMFGRRGVAVGGAQIILDSLIQ